MPGILTSRAPPSNRPKQRPPLAHRLPPFLCRIGIKHDPRASLHVQAAVLDHGGADGDAGVGVAVPAQIPDAAGIDVALDRFEFADHLQRANLQGTADGAGWEVGAQHAAVAQTRLQLAGHFADDVHDVAVAFDHDLLADLHRARLADLADVVSARSISISARRAPSGLALPLLRA